MSGIRQEADDYIACLQPRSGRKGTLALLTEPAGEHPALSVEACRLARKIIAEQYVADASLSMTSGLLAALDAANNAVLRYNYANALGESNMDSSPLVAVRAGGARARRFKVGLTAALLRTDGTGIYLAQMAPAQAYIRHNGLLTPVPETPHWRARPNSKVNRPQLTILRGDHDALDVTDTDELFHDFSQDNLLSPSLGTAPGVESNPVYRRIEDGDLVVLVTSSLARLLDRETAEVVMSGFDADAVTEALLELAIKHGLAQAHACVLAFGGPTSSGIDMQWSGPEIVTVQEGGVEATLAVEPEAVALQAHDAELETPPLQGAALSRPTFTIIEPDATQTRHADLDEDDFRLPWETPSLEVLRPVDVEQVEDAPEEPESPASLHAALRPTRLLVQHQLERPPFHAPILWEDDFEEELGELNFDGWEDSLPALSTLAEGEAETEGPDPEQVVFPWQKETRLQPLAVVSQDAQIEAPAVTPFPAPDLFGSAPQPYDAPAFDEWGEAELPKVRRFAMPTFSMPRLAIPRISAPKLPRVTMPKAPDLLKAGRNATTWARSLCQNMLPERPFRLPRVASAGGNIGGVPVRLLTALALVLVVGILAWSVFKAVGDNKQTQVNTLLEQAKQEELLANQPATNETQRLELLESALQHARQAAAAGSDTQEAQVFADKVQGQLDKLQGVTRLDLTLLFQFGQAGAADEIAGDKHSPASPASATSAGTQATQPADIIVAGNEAFVLDRASDAVYKCNISAKACAKVLGTGEMAGGQSAGKPVSMTLRQGNVLVLDDKLSVYAYNAETGAWSAEQLGDAGKLVVPKDIATYDGNLYLLGAKPGQVLKYFSGKYGEPPADWIKDPATSEQLSNPVSVAIDGSIYVLLADGKVLAMQGGKVTGSITPRPGPAAAPATDLFTSPETHDLYVLRSAGGTVNRLGKDGQTLATFMGPAGTAPMHISGLTVDEAKGQMYLVSGDRVYLALMSGDKTPARQTTTDTTGSPATGGGTAPQATGEQQPNVQPTAAP
ncbi:MAG TPA: hypothetical protein VND68_13175 [Chloroflexia bacterium]|nr:hypothetical protein [Chloroflexia bacterium]